MGSGYRGNFGSTKGSTSVAANESDSKSTHSIVKEAKEEIKRIAKQAPLKIPKNATYEVKAKKGYNQIKYKYRKNNSEYEVRWHTQTPNAPEGTGNTYQVTRKIKGKGYGKDASRKVLDHMIKYPSGKIKWVSDSTYQDAIRNKRNGTATKREREMIKYGHIQ